MNSGGSSFDLQPKVIHRKLDGEFLADQQKLKKKKINFSNSKRQLIYEKIAKRRGQIKSKNL